MMDEFELEESPAIIIKSEKNNIENDGEKQRKQSNYFDCVEDSQKEKNLRINQTRDKKERNLFKDSYSNSNSLVSP